MKQLSHKLWAKSAAMLLAVLTMLSMVTCGFGIIYLENSGYYSDSEEAILRRELRLMIDEENWEVLDCYRKKNLEFFEPSSGCYYYEISDREGRRIAGTYEGQSAFLSEETMIEYEGEYITVKGYLLPWASNDRFSQKEEWISFCYSARYWIFPLLGALAVLLCFLLIFLFRGAGCREGEEAPRLGAAERIPFDLWGVFLFQLAYLQAVLLQEFSIASIQLLICVMVALGAFDCLMLLFYAVSFSARIKMGCFWKTTVIGKGAILLWRGMRWLFSLLCALPLIWKTALGMAGISLLEFMVLLFAPAGRTVFLWWLCGRLFIIPAVLYIAFSLKKLQKGGEKIAEGNFEARIETADLKGDFKAFAETLHSIGDGINHAVEERMRSERFKTELITNVSHDIKTPLTSIVNYVDLLSKEELQNEKAEEYIAVLKRQSARMKKLIEDLLEASKAASGILAVHKEPCDLKVLLSQLVGEYEERFQKAGLSSVVCQPDAEVSVMADCRHLWRILDNLMGNVCKYAQFGTRVYIDLEETQEARRLVFRNISKDPLPKDGAELTERFARGDRSRNTEGSGLGLSIAKSLCEMQGASLQIETDGDLFKASVRFPK